MFCTSWRCEIFGWTLNTMINRGEMKAWVTFSRSGREGKDQPGFWLQVCYLKTRTQTFLWSQDGLWRIISNLFSFNCRRLWDIQHCISDRQTDITMNDSVSVYDMSQWQHVQAALPTAAEKVLFVKWDLNHLRAVSMMPTHSSRQSNREERSSFKCRAQIQTN